MNQNNSSFTLDSPGAHGADALQARFAFRVAASLSERSLDLGPDLSERLRFAREKALERAKARTADVAPVVGATRNGAAILGRSGSPWWVRFATVVPVFALIGGLVLIQKWQDNAQISVAAEVDAALLSDDLPPTAYSDAGFAEFLKSAGE